MIWVPDENGGLIYAVTDQGYLYVRADDWTDDMPISDPDLTPPAGLSQPVRGFGLVWRENGIIRDQLGWAVAPEFNYDLLYQAEARATIPGVAYLTVPEGDILRLIGSQWEPFEP